MATHDRKANPDRHKDDSKVISVRITGEAYDRLVELIGRSPLPHDTVGGYLVWLIQEQAFRKR